MAASSLGLDAGGLNDAAPLLGLSLLKPGQLVRGRGPGIGTGDRVRGPMFTGVQTGCIDFVHGRTYRCHSMSTSATHGGGRHAFITETCLIETVHCPGSGDGAEKTDDSNRLKILAPDPATSHIPVIALSTIAMPGDMKFAPGTPTDAHAEEAA